jgi:hypothetical protein
MWLPKWLAAFATLCSFVAPRPGPVEPNHGSLVKRSACGPRPIVDCEQFSPTGDNPTQHLCCREYIRGSYPRTIGGSRVDLYRYTNGWDPNDETTISNLASISDALEDVMPVYEEFGVSFDLIVIFSKTLPDIDGKGVYGYEQEKVGTTTPCFVRVQDDVPGQPVDPGLSLEQTIAHETYHCVEDANRAGQLPTDAFNGWWLEGAAEFYANDFYPDHTQGAWPRLYDGSKPLYKQSYAVSLFFVFVHGFGWSYEDINNLVFNEPQAKSFSDCLRSLSGNSDFGKAFPYFAQAFSNNLITYSDGSLVDPVTSPGPLKTEPLGLSDGGSDQWGIKAPTFTVAEFSRSLESGQSFTITWKPTSKQTSLFYRQVPATDWIDITTQPASVALNCDDDTAVYDFLFTCTDDVEEGVGVLEFVQINKQDCCTATPTAASCSTSPPPASLPTPSTPSPTPSSGGIDPCLRGKWKLDIPSTQNLLQKALAPATNFKITNSATFEVLDSVPTSVFQFLDLILEFDSISGGASIHTTITTGGLVTSTVVMGTGKEFTWKDVQASGSIITLYTSDGTRAGGGTQDISTSFGTSEVVSYVCSASSLTLTGTLNKQNDWTWAFQKG